MTDENKIETYEKVIEYLWQILDDIDNTSKIVKENNKRYRELVGFLHKKRWNTGIVSNENGLDYSAIKYPFNSFTAIRLDESDKSVPGIGNKSFNIKLDSDFFTKKISIEDAIKTLINALKKEPDFWDTCQSNIANCFYEEMVDQHARKEGRSIGDICNDAANKLLKLLTKF